MSKTYIGIDFSINSTGISILRNNKFHFISYARNGSINQTMIDSLTQSDVILNQLEPIKISKLPYTESAKLSIIDSIELSKAIMYNIKEIVKDDTDVKICIEGFSFGSTGMRLAQISGYQYILQQDLLNTFGVESLYFYVPLTVKSVFGCAKNTDDGKRNMIDQFANHDEIDMLHGLKNHKFWQAIKNNDNGLMTRTGKFKKPTDDLVDSYAILKTMIIKNGWDYNR